MMNSTQWDSALHLGDKSYVVAPERKTFVGLAAAVFVLSFAFIATLGLNHSIEFAGGLQSDIAHVSDQGESPVSRAITSTGLAEGTPEVTRVGTDLIRIQTSPLGSTQTV